MNDEDVFSCKLVVCVCKLITYVLIKGLNNFLVSYFL